MGRRLLLAVLFFGVAVGLTGVLAKLQPASLGPLSALVLAALGVLLIGLAPTAPPSAVTATDLKPIRPLPGPLPPLRAETAEVE